MDYLFQGEDNVEYFLGLTPSGIIVLRNKNKVGHYYWPRISKIYFKGRYFMIRICDKNVGAHSDEDEAGKTGTILYVHLFLTERRKHVWLRNAVETSL